MMRVLPGELGVTPGSLYVDRVVVNLPPEQWEDLNEQFPESVLVFAGAPHVVVILAEDWPDVEAQFSDARVAD